MTEFVALEFIDPAGEPLRIEWSAEALASLVAPTPDLEPVWTLSGELDWDEVEGLRILSARLAPERLLAIAALRPRQAGGHGDEVVAGAIGDGESFEQLEEVLFSSEYGPDGQLRRIGLELYREGGGMAIRVAGDALGSAWDIQGKVRRDTAAFELRSAGDQGVGILDVLTLA
jgi:hypothetical protein